MTIRSCGDFVDKYEKVKLQLQETVSPLAYINITKTYELGLSVTE